MTHSKCLSKRAGCYLHLYDSYCWTNHCTDLFVYRIPGLYANDYNLTTSLLFCFFSSDLFKCSSICSSFPSSLDLFSPSPRVLQESDKDIINVIKTFRFLLVWTVIKNCVNTAHQTLCRSLSCYPITISGSDCVVETLCPAVFYSSYRNARMND